MAWLLREDEVLASLEVPAGRGRALRAVAGRGGLEGALLVRPTRLAHTLGARRSWDVVFCDRRLVIIDLCPQVASYRLLRPRPRARAVIYGEAGWAERVGLALGDALEVRV